jgi:hypothetical protein
MDRRVFTKATTASLIAFVAGCTSLDSDPDDQDENGSTDEDSPADDEPVNENDDEEATDDGSDDSADPDEEDDDETDDDANETDSDDAETDTGEADDEDASDDPDEPDDADQGEDGGEADDERDEYDGDDADDETDNGDEDDDPPTENELEATIEMDAELEGTLEVVHHEFVWESYRGSHLCTIRVELRNVTSDTDIWFDGIGSVTDADGTGLGGDIARFGLQPQEATTHVFSMDGCADASGYRLEFATFDDG